MKTQQLLLETRNGQHLPSKNQVAKEPVKTVSKSLQKSSQLTVEDLLGLSWILFEESEAVE